MSEMCINSPLTCRFMVKFDDYSKTEVWCPREIDRYISRLINVAPITQGIKVKDNGSPS